MKRTILYIFAGIRVAAPLLRLAAVGYESVGMFVWDLICAAGIAFVCCVVADLIRRLEDAEYRADEMHARAATQYRRIDALEKTAKEENKTEFVKGSFCKSYK